MAHFKFAGKRYATERLTNSSEGGKANLIVNFNSSGKFIVSFSGSNLLDAIDHAASRSSLDSHEAASSEGIFDKFRTHVANIVKGFGVNGSEPTENPPQLTDVDEIDIGDSEEAPVNVNVGKSDSPSEYLRILSRSESGGDADIIDKVQQNNKKNCSRILQFNGNDDQILENAKDFPTK